ncbi:MAG: cation:proton antiporter, partial [Paludibacteraceae bacterium]|nr:cation:proton antiporter [Paludibacteraceae bacterium]
MDEFIGMFSLPISDPVLIFSLVLLIILLSPMIFNKLHIPHIVGLILAGVILGPFGFGLLDHDSSFRLFGQVGMLYIMFVAGIDMDMNDFLHNRNKSLVFGLLTFFIPMILGILTSVYLMYFIYTRMSGGVPITWISGDASEGELIKYSIYSAVVLASMYASNTLIA